ncbi:hypothetical protein [Rathayibacter sp. AY1D3]|uniref:hypothetical protein n=1 Tax=Rathayibacter sp. AY1D3 TaxID=2080544 RepID=UPI000CE8B158|nr:hypothetical protein [Rathayibacter sp. AY1D3]PPH86359.1 hypothetical protein C5C64_15355 [Rathayibacter sp. AY1D3]
MTTVSEYYGIPGPVPFVDVQISVDNRLFVDPHAIRLYRSPQPFAQRAIDAMDSFFSEVTACVISGTPGDHRRGNGLLQHFVEPRETRLGMAKYGFRGHGGAHEVGNWIWHTLIDDVEALVRIGALRHIEDLPLFVHKIDRDITSDVTTRIIYLALVDFTAEMIKKYPQFTAGAHEVRKFEKQVWNSTTREWDIATVSLPVIDGEPLLLVPSEWARQTLLLSAGRFYETSVLSYAQLEQAVLASDGKLLKTPKDRLKTQNGLGRGRVTNRQITQRAIENEFDLVASFKAFVLSRLPRQDEGEAA